MRLSEVNPKLLFEDERKLLVMDRILPGPNLENLDQQTVVILGCAPKLLYPRVSKLVELYQYDSDIRNIILSGGTGFHRLFANDNSKRLENIKVLSKLLPEWYGDPELLVTLSESEIAQLFLKKYGCFGDAKILLDTNSIITPHNVINTLELMKKNNINIGDGVIFITTHWHVRRTNLTAQKFMPSDSFKVISSTSDIITGLSGNHTKFVNMEANKLPEYARNGSIADPQLEEFLSPEAVFSIENSQRRR